MWRVLWILLGTAAVAWGGAADPTMTIIVEPTPEYSAMLNEWLMVHYCQHLARSGQSIPGGMTATPAGDDFVCSGTPTIQAKLDYMHFIVGELLLRAEYLNWGRAQISDLLRKNPEMDRNLLNTFPPMTLAERQVIIDAAPIQ